MSDLTFRSYQEKSRATAVYPNITLLIDPPDLDADALWASFEGAYDENYTLAEWARQHVPGLLELLNCRRDGSWVYPVLGLGDEVGEVLGKFKKLLRDHDGAANDEYTDAIVKELGDVPWYQARVADAIGKDLGDICQINLDKLASRAARGTIQGSGDDR